MNEINAKQIYDLVNNNDEVRAQLENTEGVDEIVAILNENGIAVTEEDISAAINTVQAGDCGELSEDMLEDVAGGYCKKGRNWKCCLHFVWNAFKGIWDELSK